MTTEDYRRYGQAKRELLSKLTPVTDYVEACEALIVELRSEVKVLESLRPHWAQGYSDDSVAAQASTAALAEVWDALGVANQTACMARLRELLGERT